MAEIEDYDYHLPRDLIAQHPVPRRADARLMLVDRASGAIGHYHIRDLPQLLGPHDCLVLNETKVMPARLVGFRATTRGHWEGLFLSADGQGNWRVLGKARGKLMPGETITLVSAEGREVFNLKLLVKEDDGQWIVRPDLNTLPDKHHRPASADIGNLPDAWGLLELAGRVPLPPYIRSGEMVAADRDRYQTVFATKPGAIAAPTAGLHLTQDLLAKLETQGVGVARLTLHVGLDTFRPITVTYLADHVMHSERGEIDATAVARIDGSRKAGGRTVAVGTTCVRVLETAAADGTLRPWQGETRLFIQPGYRFHAVDALLTNFHLPRTTLLVLVYTFGGRELIERAYEEAVREEYRFFSYGDAMLIV